MGITNWERTELLRWGSLCKGGKKICQEWLRDGKYVWRVAGVEKVEGSTQWKFCGVEGVLGQELQFTIRKGKCIPGDLIDASLCETEFQSIVSLKGIMMLANAQSAVLTEYDSEILEAQMMSALHAESVQLTSWELSGSDLLVYFTAKVVGQKLGYDALNAESSRRRLLLSTTHFPPPVLTTWMCPTPLLSRTRKLCRLDLCSSSTDAFIPLKAINVAIVTCVYAVL